MCGVQNENLLVTTQFAFENTLLRFFARPLLRLLTGFLGYFLRTYLVSNQVLIRDFGCNGNFLEDVNFGENATFGKMGTLEKIGILGKKGILG